MEFSMKGTLWFIAVFLHFALVANGQRRNVKVVRIDATKTFQTFDGIGVNANTRSWNEKELEPALNLLLDSMHATIWRVLVETVEKWEDVNDNNDPFTLSSSSSPRWYPITIFSLS